VSFEKVDDQPRWNGWGNGSANQRFQPAPGTLTAAEVPKLKLKWAFAVPGVIRMYGQPAVVGGTLFFGTASDKILALDAETGCIKWQFEADAGVRTAISVGRIDGRWMAFFGDLRGQVYGIDAAAGAPVWKQRVDDHPMAYITAAPNLYDGRLYV